VLRILENRTSVSPFVCLCVYYVCVYFVCVCVSVSVYVCVCVCVCVCVWHLWLGTPGIRSWRWERDITLIIASTNAESIHQSEEILLTILVNVSTAATACPCRCNCCAEASLSTCDFKLSCKWYTRIHYIYLEYSIRVLRRPIDVSKYYNLQFGMCRYIKNKAVVTTWA
jgi:hypothetical protein